MTQTIIVLGGYGNFGRHIAGALVREPNTKVLVAGRDASRARELASNLRGDAEPYVIDTSSDNFVDRLEQSEASLVVHTAGPFQGQNYSVAEACIRTKCHYIDLADSRRFVMSIDSLNEQAHAANVLVASGASTLPSLSTAIVERMSVQFASMSRVEIAISAGARPPGLATMQGVLAYVGRPHAIWHGGEWRTAYGWQDIRRRKFQMSVGARWLGNCDVPDLDLLRNHFPSLESVRFQAGTGFASTTLAVWLLSWLVRVGLIKDASAYAHRLRSWAVALERFGPTTSAMSIEIVGVDASGAELRKTWELIAANNHGPIVPCLPAIALAKRIIRNDVMRRGAMPCVGLLSAEEILCAVPDLDLSEIENGRCGG